MNEVKIFNNPEFGDIRAVLIEGEPWFVGRDIALELGYAKPQNALRDNVDEGDARKWGVPDSNNHIQQMIMVNESGLYSLIFGSKLESAKKFKKWVTSEVIQSIRKSGSYGVVQLPQISPCDIPLGELASYLKVIDRAAVRQNTPPHKIMEALKMISEQFGVRLPEDIVNAPEYEQLTLTDMMKESA